MTAEVHSYHPEQAPQEPQEVGHEDAWEDVMLGGEKFRAKKNRIWQTFRDGEEVLFNVNIYDHEATGMHIKVYSRGLDQDVSKPAIVRPDFGCPCMTFGTRYTTPGHDCAKQRDMMIDALADIGVGAFAEISEQTASGNGHGDAPVFDQTTIQYKARKNGDDVPSMQQFYTDHGYFPFDKRRHDLVAKVLADTVGLERPILLAMSSENKVQKLREEGMNIIEGMRVEFVTEHAQLHENILRRSTHPQISLGQPGTYLAAQDSSGTYFPRIKLSPEVYNGYSFARTTSLPQRRIIN